MPEVTTAQRLHAAFANSVGATLALTDPGDLVALSAVDCDGVHLLCIDDKEAEDAVGVGGCVAILQGDVVPARRHADGHTVLLVSLQQASNEDVTTVHRQNFESSGDTAGLWPQLVRDTALKQR